MDTPETSHKAWTPRNCSCDPQPFRPGQRGGKEATLELRKMAKPGEAVRAECYELGTYGRPVCHVFKGPINLNLEMIRRGWGWLPSKAAWIRDPRSGPAQAGAKAARRGAWGLPGQIHPREWRVQCWREGKCAGAVNWPYKP